MNPRDLLNSRLARKLRAPSVPREDPVPSSCRTKLGSSDSFPIRKLSPSQYMPRSIDRPAQRVDIRLSATLTFEGSTVGLPAVSINLSETGVLVQAGRQVQRGTAVHLEFKEISSDGEVIWTRKTTDMGSLLGIKFISLGWRYRRFIKTLVSSAGRD